MSVPCSCLTSDGSPLCARPSGSTTVASQASSPAAALATNTAKRRGCPFCTSTLALGTNGSPLMWNGYGASPACEPPRTSTQRSGSSRNSGGSRATSRSEEHTSELQSQFHLVCRLLLEKKKKKQKHHKHNRLNH